jgi:zinc transporter, ZIP family
VEVSAASGRAPRRLVGCEGASWRSRVGAAPARPAGRSGAVMSDALLLAAIAAATVLATGIGALPVIALGASRARGAQGVLSGLAAGVMAIAATVGLLKPAAEQGSATIVVTAAVAGVIALVVSRLALRNHARHSASSEAGARSLLVIGVLFAHSLPEGFAIGSAFASSQSGLSAFVITAIAIQNVPEGTATAAAMQPAGYGAVKQFWGAVLTSVPQVPGALVAWLAVEQVNGLLPASFALAGGAMLALVFVDLLPDAWKHASHVRVVVGTVAGALLMLAVGAVLEV